MSASWSPTKLQALASGWRDGRGCAELAADLGVTAAAVRAKRYHLGLPARSAEAIGLANSHNGSTQATGLRPLRLQQGGGQAPKGFARASAWAPLPGSQPQPFGDRPALACCWPVDAADAVLACSLPQVEGSPYCETHQRLSRSEQQPPPLRI